MTFSFQTQQKETAKIRHLFCKLPSARLVLNEYLSYIGSLAIGIKSLCGYSAEENQRKKMWKSLLQLLFRPFKGKEQTHFFCVGNSIRASCFRSTLLLARKPLKVCVKYISHDRSCSQTKRWRLLIQHFH